MPRFDSIQSLAEYRLENVPFGQLVVSQLVTDARDSYLDLNDVRDRAERLLRNAISLYFTARSVIRERKVDKVYVWNGRRCSDGPVVYAARDEGIEYAVFISGGRENSYLVKKALRVHDLESNKNEVRELYAKLISEKGHEYVEKEARTFYEAQRFGGAKHPGFIHVAAQFSSTEEALALPRSISLLLFTSSYWEYFGMVDHLHHYPPYRNHYDAIRLILQDPRLSKLKTVVVRWHPYLSSCGPREREHIERLIADTSSHFIHILPESRVDSYALISSATKVLTLGSTIGIEAAYYGKPSILVGRAAYEDTGAVYRPRDHEQLMDLLLRDLPAGQRTGAVKYGLWARRYGNHEFVHLRRREDGEFVLGHTPVRYQSAAQRIRSLLVRLARIVGVYQLLKTLQRSLRAVA